MVLVLPSYLHGASLTIDCKPPYGGLQSIVLLPEVYNLWSYSQTVPDRIFVPAGSWVWSTAYSIFVHTGALFFSDLTLDVIEDCITHCVPTIYSSMDIH